MSCVDAPDVKSIRSGRGNAAAWASGKQARCGRPEVPVEAFPNIETFTRRLAALPGWRRQCDRKRCGCDRGPPVLLARLPEGGPQVCEGEKNISLPRGLKGSADWLRVRGGTLER